MKGFGKAVKRTPHLLTTKVGMSKRSVDPEFDEYQKNFGTMEVATDKLLKDTKAFTDAVIALFTSGTAFSSHFANLFRPMTGEFDLLGKHPEAASTVKNVDAYETTMEELRSAVSPELELIQSRIAGPVKELQGVLKMIRKSITKRDHKLTDYDRFNSSLTKLRDKKEKSLSDEKNLFKLEQDFEVATNEYDYINNALKTDLPRFMTLATQFIDPLFHSFFYMQLNIYYILLEKLNGFAEGKYDTSSVSGAQIAQEYEEKRTDAWNQIENLNIIKRIISVAKLVQAQRANSLATGSSLGRSPSAATTSSSISSSRAPPPSRTPSTFSKKAPPPPPPSAVNPPPPYSPSESSPSELTKPFAKPYSPSPPRSLNGGVAAAAAAAAKRAPPPPPPLKPKPKAVQYVVALYDFDAQADGDLSFKTGDRIEIVEKTASSEDWWTGKLNGAKGVFPGNYVQTT